MGFFLGPPPSRLAHLEVVVSHTWLAIIYHLIYHLLPIKAEDIVQLTP